MRLMVKHTGLSDHNPLFLSLVSSYNWGPKPFRTYDAWFLNPDFKRFIKDEWLNLPNLPLNRKLKSLKAPIRVWSRDKFDGMDKKINELELFIHHLEN